MARRRCLRRPRSWQSVRLCLQTFDERAPYCKCVLACGPTAVDHQPYPHCWQIFTLVDFAQAAPTTATSYQSFTQTLPSQSPRQVARSSPERAAVWSQHRKVVVDHPFWDHLLAEKLNRLANRFVHYGGRPRDAQVEQVSSACCGGCACRAATNSPTNIPAGTPCAAPQRAGSTGKHHGGTGQRSAGMDRRGAKAAGSRCVLHHTPTPTIYHFSSHSAQAIP